MTRKECIDLMNKYFEDLSTDNMIKVLAKVMLLREMERKK